MFLKLLVGAMQQVMIVLPISGKFSDTINSILVYTGMLLFLLSLFQVSTVLNYITQWKEVITSPSVKRMH